MQASGLVERFKTKAEAVQAVVSEIENLDTAVHYAIDLTRRQGGRTIAAPGFAAEALQRLRKECEAAGLTLLEPPLRPQADRIHTALTIMDGGIAETGSLVLNSSSEDIRIATMLSETHIAVTTADSIVADTEAFEARLDTVLKQDAPSYTAFITGASRTADIERVLAIGVHGPQELHILIWGGRSV